MTWGIVVFGVLMAIAIFNPGFMSYDTIEQLKQARTGRFGDWHPPFMAFTWRSLEWFVVGPLGMLALQAAAWWVGVALIVHHLAPRRAAPWLTLVLGFWPPIFTMVGTVWKDVQMAAALTLAAGLLLADARAKRPWALLAALLALFYAGAMRHNAASSVLPFALWAGFALAGRVGLTGRLKAGGVAIALSALLILAPAMTNKALVSVTEPPILQTLFTWDLLGMSAFAGENLMPPELEPRRYTARELAAFYTAIPLTSSVIHFHPQGLHLKFVDAEGLTPLREHWVAAIRAHPDAYFKHRADLMRAQLGFNREVWYPYHWAVDPNPLKVSWRPSKACIQYLSAMHELKDSLLFRTWLYLALLLVCGLLAWQALTRGDRRAAVTLAFATSGWLNFLPYALISTGADLRYNLWTIVCGVFALLATWSAAKAGANAR